MSSSSQVPDGHPSPGAYVWMKAYLGPPCAAAVAIVPTFYGFVVKSAQQAGEPIPRMTMIGALWGGVKAAPTIGSIVGTQMGVQHILERMLIAQSGAQQKKQPSLWSMLCSSMIVGVVSVPALAIFNGQTLGRTPSQSLKALSAKQAGAIVARETSFLLSLRLSDPVTIWLKQFYGEGPVVEYGAPFLSGVIGSVVGHAPDTLLTRLQKGQATQWRHLMLGSPAKAVAVGAFSALYSVVKKRFES